MRERIEGLESMDCGGICDALRAIEDQAAKDAEALQAEIGNAYIERDKAAEKMHRAAEAKDIKAYKDARMHYDMYAEYIGKAEQRYYDLTEGNLIAGEDVGEIRSRMNTECYKTLQAAAVKIQDAQRQMYAAQTEALKEIRERNKVLSRLHTCTRPKDQYGEQLPPQLFRDTVIGPYLNALEEFVRLGGDQRTAAFLVFAGQPAADPVQPAGNPGGIEPERPATWNGDRWIQA